jgi:phage terminase large subunit
VPGVESEFFPAIEGISSGTNSHLLILGNPTVSSGYFYEAFTRNAALWTRFTISAFDTPNFAGCQTLEALLTLSDNDLDGDSWPMLVTRRWVSERYREWWNGTPENSPLWQARVLAEFPSSSSNALLSLAWLENARRAATDSRVGGEIIVGIDVAGQGETKRLQSPFAARQSSIRRRGPTAMRADRCWRG